MQTLFLIRTLHTIIYIIMAFSVVTVLVCGIFGFFGSFLLLPLLLLGLEGIVFFGNRMRCPLTALAKKYGAEKGFAFDTFLPEAITKYTFKFFTSLLVLGLILLSVRMISQWMS